MPPKLTGIDHVHVYVPDRDEAAKWYEDVLGFTAVELFKVWADETGPLTLEDSTGKVHIALFQRADFAVSTNIAFGARGAEFLEWKSFLEARGLEVRCSDHALAWSIYFNDPYGNMHEITTYDHEFVAIALGTGAA